MVARTTLEEDGVRYRYEFLNRSKILHDMTSRNPSQDGSPYFHDVRLERSARAPQAYGFELLASEHAIVFDHAVEILMASQI